MDTRSTSSAAVNGDAHREAGISANDLKAALEKILQESVSSVRERERNALEKLLAATGNRCVLFGAGSLGQRALAQLKRIGVQPLAASDNNPELWGSAIEGTPVLSPGNAAERFGKDAVFFIAIRNEMHWYPATLEQLRSLGCLHVASAASLGWRFPETFLPFLLYDLPHKLYEQADRVLLAGQLWEDDASRAEYLAQIRLRALGEFSDSPKPAVEQSYFLKDVFETERGEVMLDCGAFDGDTIRNLIARQPGFGGIEAAEPDSNSFEKLARYIDTLDIDTRRRIRLHRCAIGARRGTVRFQNAGATGSKISGTEGTYVDMVPIDELCASTCVTMIKMDIEGAEFEALVGGKQVIQRDRPILAVCVYHSQDDIWRLPLLMHKIFSDGKMYVRAHGGDGIQTVAYTVPPERVLAVRS